ncbi:MAG TPA: hypothetical protein VKB18_04115 [Gemmatimonadota bacterium]|nr:hypothetical protein [Gemmatimonadota bacterium]
MSTASRAESISSQRDAARVVAGGSTVEAVAGGGAVVLAILGLSGVSPAFLAAIATIAVGAALLSEGGAIATRYSELVSELSESSMDDTELGAGMTTEFLGGIAGIVLGILALLGVSRWSLMSVAAIVFGGSLLIGSTLVSELNHASLAARARRHGKEMHGVARQAVKAAVGTQVLVGLGAAVLGILALIGLTPHVLTLVAFLSVAGATVLSGSAVSARFQRAVSA